MSFPRLKLSYFDMAGRAEATRLAFFVGGIPFEDHRFQRQEMEQLKDSCPYGVVPILQVNDEVLAESNAIAKYAGRLAGLYPVSDPSAAALVDEAMLAADQFGESFRTWWTVPADDVKKVLEHKLLHEVVPQRFAYVDRLLETMSKHPSFQDASRLYIHEIWLHQFIAVFLRPGFIPFIPTDILDGYPHWQRCLAKVDAHPRVVEYKAIQQRRAKDIKLVSFPFNGRDGPIRLALEMGGVAFQDVRVEDHTAFAKKYPALPPTQSFVLEVDGEVLSSQAFAALGYAGTLAGLYPADDPVAALRIDEVFGVVEAFYNTLLPTLLEKDPQAKRAVEELAKGDVAKHLGGLDKRLKKRALSFATGDGMTVADLAIHGAVAFVKSGAVAAVPTALAAEFPTLLSIHDRVAARSTP